MKTFKPNESEVTELQAAATALKQANEMLASAGKTVESAKEKLAKWLKNSRSVEIETMEIGDMVEIAGVCLIERAKQNKFDVKAFAMAQPVLTLTFTRPFPITKFKPLV